MNSDTYRYRDLDGNRYEVKPEHMTQLRGDVLVPKTHPVIRFRGGMDCLLAKAMEVQILAAETGHPDVVDSLQDVSAYISAILMAEVTEQPVAPRTMFGYEPDELKRMSHSPKKYLGVDHMLPDYTMGKTFSAVNALRAQARQVELTALEAFVAADGTVSRDDVVKAMNRLSSAIYVLMCRLLAEKRG